VREKLGQVSIDYRDIPSHTDQSQQKSSPHLKAAVVLLLHFKKMPDGRSEYHFLLIKRSNKVSQGGDISCPGGMLQPQKDNFLSFLLKKGIVPVMTGKTKQIQNVEAANAALIHLFLTTALREAWEEIGLNPFNTKFLGALPPYPLTMFARTIFPLVCTTRKPFTFKTNFEVEKIIEIPLSYFLTAVIMQCWISKHLSAKIPHLFNIKHLVLSFLMQKVKTIFFGEPPSTSFKISYVF